jgi:anti-anti-sigma factor
MEVREGSVDAVTVIEVKGRVDSTTAPALGERLTGALAAPRKRVIVDLSGADYLSSAGLRVLLRAAEQADRTDGKLVLHGLNSRVREVFEISGFLGILTICSTRDEALVAAAA